MRPDPGRSLLDGRVAVSSATERAEWAARKRELGLALVWQQSDVAGPMDELARAMFILDRLYPQMLPAHRCQIDTKLRSLWQAGRWHGFERPEELHAGPLTRERELPSHSRALGVVRDSPDAVDGSEPEERSA